MRTISKLRQRGRIEIRPRIVGYGPFLSTVEALKTELGLPDLSVESHLSSAEDIYGGADVLLLMSRVEGTPNVVIEAQCCGLAVAACDVGGVREAVGPGNLILPAVISPEEAASRIEDWLLSLDQANLADRIAAVRQKYDMSRLAETAFETYGLPKLWGKP